MDCLVISYASFFLACRKENSYFEFPAKDSRATTLKESERDQWWFKNNCHWSLGIDRKDFRHQGTKYAQRFYFQYPCARMISTYWVTEETDQSISVRRSIYFRIVNSRASPFLYSVTFDPPNNRFSLKASSPIA